MLHPAFLATKKTTYHDTWFLSIAARLTPPPHTHPTSTHPHFPAGDILPRPSFLESSLHRGPGHSIKLHLLGAYARSFAAVILGQFDSKAQGEASRQALRELLGAKFVQVRSLLAGCAE